MATDVLQDLPAVLGLGVLEHLRLSRLIITTSYMSFQYILQLFSWIILSVKLELNNFLMEKCKIIC